MAEKISTMEMESVIAGYFNSRTNIIVPNVSWGMLMYECDMVVLSKTGYAFEVEIKTEKYDLIRDKLKPHKHGSKLMSGLYFALPWYLLEYQEHVPDRAGILVVEPHQIGYGYTCKKTRNHQQWSKHKWSLEQRFALARLGTMRIWSMQHGLIRDYNDIKYLQKIKKELETDKQKCNCGAEAVMHHCAYCWAMEIDEVKTRAIETIEESKAENAISEKKVE